MSRACPRNCDGSRSDVDARPGVSVSAVQAANLLCSALLSCFGFAPRGAGWIVWPRSVHSDPRGSPRFPRYRPSNLTRSASPKICSRSGSVSNSTPPTLFPMKGLSHAVSPVRRKRLTAIRCRDARLACFDERVVTGIYPSVLRTFTSRLKVSAGLATIRLVRGSRLSADPTCRRTVCIVVCARRRASDADVPLRTRERKFKERSRAGF